MRSEQKDQEPRDIMSWLLKAKEDGDPCAPPGDQAIEEDARLLIIAGREVPLYYQSRALLTFRPVTRLLQQSPTRKYFQIRATVTS